MHDERDVVVQSVAGRWQVTGVPPAADGQAMPPDLRNAVVLAELLAAQRAWPARPTLAPRPGAAPRNPGAGGPAELVRLGRAVRALEQAVTTRVQLERAVGVLAERWETTPWEAFQRLWDVVRKRQLVIHDVAAAVLASSTGGATALPEGLPARRCSRTG